MKSRFLSSSVSAIVTLLFAAYASTSYGADEKITVMNPAIAGKIAPRAPLSPRLDTLEGKTIYMVDNQWGGPEGAYQLLEEMQAWFTANMPSVKVIVRRTKDNMFGDDPALWKEISEKGDAAIIGTGQ
ncbi:MAG: Thiol-disulfide oxidoreductase protein [Gammaproteobacteria bacterium]|nr:Thiol-disulfide oxidoreductase protein [Gammaproteobacteria bacterium]